MGGTTMGKKHAMAVLLLMFASQVANAVEQEALSAAKLIESARSADVETRKQSLEKLRGLGSLSDQDQYALFAIFQDGKLATEIRTAALEALLDVCGPPTQFIVPVTKTLRNRQEPEEIREFSVITLQLIIQASDTSSTYDEIRALAPDLAPKQSKNPATQSKLLESLRAMRDVVKDKSEPKDFRVGVLCGLSVLADFDGQTCQLLQAVAADHHEHSDVRKWAIEGAAMHANLARENALDIFQSILRVAEDRSEPLPIRHEALGSLWRIAFHGPSTWMLRRDDILDALLHALACPSGDVAMLRASAAHSRVLFKLAADPTDDQEIRESACNLITMLPQVDPALVEPLVELLHSDAEFLRDEAAEALGEIGIPARRAAPALLAVWLDSTQPPKVCDAAGNALYRVDRRRAEALGIENPSGVE